MPDRAIVYLSGAHEDAMQEQLAQCEELCRHRGYTIVGVAREEPGSTAAWEDAHEMIYEGEADRVVYASSVCLPDMLESATGGIAPLGEHQRPGQHRVRPVRRGGAA